jgi:hypothetical protein
MIALMIHKYLRFIFKPAEGDGMDNPVAVALMRVAHGARVFRNTPPAALARVAGIRRKAMRFGVFHWLML